MYLAYKSTLAAPVSFLKGFYKLQNYLNYLRLVVYLGIKNIELLLNDFNMANLWALKFKILFKFKIFKY
jgi:hypothetical protein